MKLRIEMSEKEMRYCGDLASILGLPGLYRRLCRYHGIPREISRGGPRNPL